MYLGHDHITSHTNKQTHSFCPYIRYISYIFDLYFFFSLIFMMFENNNNKKKKERNHFHLFQDHVILASTDCKAPTQINKQTNEKKEPSFHTMWMGFFLFIKFFNCIRSVDDDDDDNNDGHSFFNGVDHYIFMIIMMMMIESLFNKIINQKKKWWRIPVSTLFFLHYKQQQ